MGSKIARLVYRYKTLAPYCYGLCWCLYMLGGVFSTNVYSSSYSKVWGSVTYFGHYDRLLYTVEPQVRLINRPNPYEQFLLNAGIGTAMQSQWQLWIGQTYINYAESNDIAEDVSSSLLNEYRIWEQAMWRRPFFDKWASRTRIEERRAFQDPAWAVRLRERAYLTEPFNQKLALALSDEFFINVNTVPWVTTSTFDQNRVFIGLFYKVTSSIGVNVTYMNQFINKHPNEDNNGAVINFIITDS